ncbi:MAG: M67 family metallopeptidase [Planctomycetes bacterium]|nr:M67 family metallopeptidase [Planctomycetota bacterium]NUQ34981.1 M67 family metallopeptidase [Planctomycetaceae bacterium]
MTKQAATTGFTIQLGARARDVLTRLVRAGYPHETCGVLTGVHADGRTEIRGVVEARNLNTERAHDRFELAPDDFVAADATARKAGLDVVGIWHSHPDHPAKPSKTDLERAWEGWSYIIVSVGKDGVKDIRSWRLWNGDFVEEQIDGE